MMGLEPTTLQTGRGYVVVGCLPYSRAGAGALVFDGLPLLVGDHLLVPSALFWPIITKVERKIASSETIIVSRQARR
jgi:hypothetical protein